MYLVLIAESHAPSANILTAGDAMWWAYVTITTVGYGDRFPTSTMGRLVGILVMTTGVAVFATFAGLISSKLLAPPEKTKNRKSSLSQEKIRLKQYLMELKQLMSDREKIDKEITSRVEKLEPLLEKGK